MRIPNITSRLRMADHATAPHNSGEPHASRASSKGPGAPVGEKGEHRNTAEGGTPPGKKSRVDDRTRADHTASRTAHKKVHGELKAAQHELESGQRAYEQRYGGKWFFQQGLDKLREATVHDAHGRGYRDDAVKNYATSLAKLSQLEHQVKAGTIDASHARRQLHNLMRDFHNEDKRVTQAQDWMNGTGAKLAEQVVRNGGAAATGIGVTLASGGNFFLGAAAATGYAQGYDYVVGSAARAQHLVDDRFVAGSNIADRSALLLVQDTVLSGGQALADPDRRQRVARQLGEDALRGTLSAGGTAISGALSPVLTSQFTRAGLSPLAARAVAGLAAETTANVAQVPTDIALANAKIDSDLTLSPAEKARAKHNALASEISDIPVTALTGALGNALPLAGRLDAQGLRDLVSQYGVDAVGNVLHTELAALTGHEHRHLNAQEAVLAATSSVPRAVRHGVAARAGGADDTPSTDKSSSSKSNEARPVDVQPDDTQGGSE